MARFTDAPTTQWFTIFDSVKQGTPEARKAFGKLVGVYWSPVFDFVKDWFGAEKAQDLTQDIFARILEKNDLKKFVEKNKIRDRLENNEIGPSSEDLQERRARPWFRFWLRKVVRNHLIRHRQSEEAEIHGGGTWHVDVLDPEISCREELIDTTTAEKLFDRQRGYAFIAQVEERVRADPAYRDQPDYFEALKNFLTDDTDELQRETAARFDKTPGAIRKAVFDFKNRYRKYLDAALAESGGGVEYIEKQRQKLLEDIQSDE